jgi:hypothetical protein
LRHRKNEKIAGSVGTPSAGAPKAFCMYLLHWLRGNRCVDAKRLRNGVKSMTAAETLEGIDVKTVAAGALS